MLANQPARRYERGMPQKRTSRDLDTFARTEESLRTLMGAIEPED